jgi:hypothetical protein
MQYKRPTSGDQVNTIDNTSLIYVLSKFGRVAVV